MRAPAVGRTSAGLIQPRGRTTRGRSPPSSAERTFLGAMRTGLQGNGFADGADSHARGAHPPCGHRRGEPSVRLLRRAALDRRTGPARSVDPSRTSPWCARRPVHQHLAASDGGGQRPRDLLAPARSEGAVGSGDRLRRRRGHALLGHSAALPGALGPQPRTGRRRVRVARRRDVRRLPQQDPRWPPEGHRAVCWRPCRGGDARRRHLSTPRGRSRAERSRLDVGPSTSAHGDGDLVGWHSRHVLSYDDPDWA